jgi:hypothetical protein
VSCRSVKLLDECEEDDSGVTRDKWWQEIRQELRGHARCLGCNVVVGYTEDTVISEDCVVMCASGTAATCDISLMLDLDSSSGIFGPPFLNSGMMKIAATKDELQQQQQQYAAKAPVENCSYLHVPYVDYSLPYSCKLSKCATCGKGRVPDVLFSTIEPPPDFQITGRGCLLQAKVLRLKKDLKGEQNAMEISHALPFVEYEIHRQLINKMKVKGMNALFGMKSKISIGDRTIIATVTATACFLTCLAPPSHPKLMCSTTSSAFQKDPDFLQRTQKQLSDRISENEEYYGLNKTANSAKVSRESSAADGLEMTEPEDGPEADFSTGNKDACVLEVLNRCMGMVWIGAD